MSLSKIIEGNWDELQGKIKDNWGKLTDDDIKKFEGSYDKLVGKLKKTYGYKEEELEEQLHDFLRSEGFISIKEKAEALWENAREVKDRVKSSLQDSAGVIKDRTHDAQENVITYIKENPFKSVGIALLTGLMAGKLLKKID